MSRVLNSDKLIKSVRQRAMIPTDTSVYTDQNILDILNEEMDIGLLPTLMSLNEEHLVVFEEIDLDGSTSRYRIPYRAVANKLRDVAYIDSNGNAYELSRISLEEISDYNSSYAQSRNSVFYIEGDEIVLVDNDFGSFERIRMYFYLRPNTIVKTNEVGVVSAIDRDNGIISVSNFPSTFSNLDQMDFVGKRSPNKTYKYDIQPLSIDSNTKTITFTTTDIPKELIVGDYLCIREESPVPQIPTEMHPVLAQMAAVHILEALGDTEGLNNASKRLDKMSKATMQIVDDRVEGSAQKVNPRHGTLNKSRGSRGSL